MPKGKGHDVICPGCRESYHETTRRYNPNRDANAGMLKLKDEYISYGWDQPPPDPTAGYGFLECPQCGAPLAPSGRLEVREREVSVDKRDIFGVPPGQIEVVQQDDKGDIKGFKCPHPDCVDSDKVFKTKANLGAHMRVHKKKLD